MNWPVRGSWILRAVGPPLPQRVLLQDQRDAEGGQDGGERIAPEQRPQGDDLQSSPEDGDDEGGRQEGQPEVAGECQGGSAGKAAQHDQVPVGEVDDVHDAEDQGEPRRHQGEDHTVHDPVDRLDDEGVHWLDPQILVDDGLVGP